MTDTTKTARELLDDISLRLSALAETTFLAMLGGLHNEADGAGVNAAFGLRREAEAIRDAVDDVNLALIRQRRAKDTDTPDC